MSAAIAELEARLRAAPRDEASWRVHADHLLDRGDRRGELVTLAEVPGAADGYARLDAELRNAWLPDLQPEFGTVAWKYGFPVELDYRIHGAGGFATLGQLLADPRMRLCGRLTLRLNHDLPNPAIAPLARVALGNIVELTVSGGGSGGNAVAQALVRNATLRLRALTLQQLGLGNMGVRALIRSKRLRGLTSLWLRGGFDATWLAALLASPLVATLEELGLGRIELADATVLAQARLDTLRRLDIKSFGSVRHAWPDDDHEGDSPRAIAEMRAILCILAGSRTLHATIVERFRSIETAWEEAEESSP
jgi:hypothetical protein